jgi:hypothetical protein
MAESTLNLNELIDRIETRRDAQANVKVVMPEAYTTITYAALTEDYGVPQALPMFEWVEARHLLRMYLPKPAKPTARLARYERSLLAWYPGATVEAFWVTDYPDDAVFPYLRWQ